MVLSEAQLERIIVDKQSPQKMAKSESSSMNVSALKLKDPYFKDILDMATHVALYNYNSDTQSWEKTEVEGAYFIYSRTKEPFYYALIMNRLNTSDHIEYIDENVELQLDEPFILYKNAQGKRHQVSNDKYRSEHYRWSRLILDNT